MAWPLRARRRPERDHALAMHRFVGGVQVLGGGTLAMAYALGGDAVGLPGAAAVLVLIGLLQVGVGVAWFVKAEVLKTLVERRPGTFVAATLAPAVLVATLGGSGLEGLWVTSAQCWLVAAGAALPGARIAVAGLAVTLVATLVWVAVDGSSGGFDGDGDYLLAVLAMAKLVIVGLWIGQVTGATWRLLARWHAIERHERGVVLRIREQLDVIDQRAASVARYLATLSPASSELAALRARLERGVALRDATQPVRLGIVEDELAGEHDAAGLEFALEFAVERDVADRAVSPFIVDALIAVARRQLANVARHAPTATQVLVALQAEDTLLRLVITDDGGGRTPERVGTGTTWSAKQLRRLGGSARYFETAGGLGFEVTLPTAPRDQAPEAPEQSVGVGLRRFSSTTFTVLRCSGYLSDTIAVYAVDGIDARWLLMPLGALLIELAIQRGVPGLRLDRAGRVTVGAVLSVVLVLVFTIPADSPEQVVPATTSVVVPAMLLLEHRTWSWIVLELARALAVAPLVARYGHGAVELVVVYPLLFSLLVYGLRRFIDAAQGLQQRVLDALGRAALASAAVRGLALHHDAVDVLLRTAQDTPELRETGAELEDAIRELEALAASSADPLDAVREGVAAALDVPVSVVPADPAGLGGRGVELSAALDRIGLVEVAALAAEERASCAPPGVLGRRRLRGLVIYEVREPGSRPALELVADPHLASPDPAKLERLRAVAQTVGIEVHSSDQALRLLLDPS